MTTLLYGDTIRYPAVRHEVPIAIMDPLLFVEHDGRALVLTNVLERERIAAALPDAELALLDELGYFDLIAAGMGRDEAELEVVVRALERRGVEEAVTAPDLPRAVTDRVRAAGIRLAVDCEAVEARRRAMTPAELAGIDRAQRAAEAGMAAAEELIKGADRADGRLVHGGEPLTAERVRDAIR